LFIELFAVFLMAIIAPSGNPSACWRLNRYPLLASKNRARPVAESPFDPLGFAKRVCQLPEAEIAFGFKQIRNKYDITLSPWGLIVRVGLWLSNCQQRLYVGLFVF